MGITLDWRKSNALASQAFRARTVGGSGDQNQQFSWRGVGNSHRLQNGDQLVRPNEAFRRRAERRVDTMPFAFEKTKLWQRAFASDEYTEEKQRITQSHRKFWSNTCELAKLIASDLPGLTLHDERHFEALWQRADQIAGDEFPINPLELFAFGGGVLLHDAGLTLAAYAGGLDDLKQTLAWRDAEALLEAASVAAVTSTAGATGAHDSMARDTELQFEALRQLHASKAEDLSNLTLALPDSRGRVHLIEDDSLRRHLGRIIGQIAASHHWQLHVLEQKLPKEIGALGGFPSAWTIRPIVLACLLRCADAAQVDQQRAPDFSYALLRGNRNSEKHWRAQNRLAQPFVTGDALTYTSTMVFARDDAEAWWLVADALSLAHKELESCHRLLATLNTRPFAIRAIRDANAPDRLRVHIRVNGWEPVSMGTRISNAKAVIQMLGGQLLYEQEGLAVPMRELIQNAADAVRARRALENPDASYQGWVEVKIEEADDLHSWITVQDNGVGMTQRILTGPLIDFGHSLWHSELVKEVLPGFASRRVEQIGQYGIGFYSTMMVSNYLTVSSRFYTAGLESIHSLEFTKGLLNNGILVRGSTVPMGINVRTIVRMKVAKDVVNEFLKVNTRDIEFYSVKEQRERPSITLEMRLSILCVALDCDVYSKFGKGPKLLAHRADWRETDAKKWLDGVLLSSLREDREFARAVQIAASTLREVTDDGACRGRAAISFWRFHGAELQVVGGFSVRPPSIGWEGSMSRVFGFIASASAGPRRSAGEYRVRPQALAEWASDQAIRLATANLTPMEAHQAALAVSEFGGAVAPIANIYVNGQLRPLEELSMLLIDGHKAIIPLFKGRKSGNYIGNLSDSIRLPGSISGRSLMRVSDEITCLVEGPENIMTDRDYYLINVDTNKEHISALGCLRSRLRELGYSMLVTFNKSVSTGVYTGQDFDQLDLKTGMAITQHVAEVSAAKRQKADQERLEGRATRRSGARLPSRRGRAHRRRA